MGKGQPLRKARKHLAADALFRIVYAGFGNIPDGQPPDATISLADALMNGFALFALKDPSLLAFDKRRQEDPKNLEMIFHIQNVPCDTQMRTILDPLSPAALRPVFRDVFRELQRGKVLEGFTFLDGYYLLSLDGTGYFSSGKVHCESCMQKTSRNGKTTYYHQMLGAAIVHPDFKEVVPLMPEPIIKQDGQTKNDCERNAAKRFFEHFRADHPHLPVIVVEDGLSSNAPHIRECQHYNMRFLLGVKEGDHAFLFQHVRELRERGEVEEFEVIDEASGVRHRYLFAQQVPLNESNGELLVNFLEYWEIHPDGRTQHFSWVTDLALDRRRAPLVVRGGRARWKIENETLGHAEESRLSVRTQLRTWQAEPVGGVCHVDDAGVLGGPNATAMLSVVPRGLGETGQQENAVGTDAVAVSRLHALFDARALGGPLSWLRKAPAGILHRLFLKSSWMAPPLIEHPAPRPTTMNLRARTPTPVSLPNRNLIHFARIA